MIKITDLHKSYGKNEVLSSINLKIEGPGIIALLGPNGSGKTTLIKCLLGMVMPDQGNIFFEGTSVLKRYSYRSKISYLSQIGRFPENLTVRELISLMKDINGKAAREDIFIKMFRLEKELDKKMGSLSGGTRQKVNITLAMMHDTPLMVLDEPSTGLDPLSLKSLKSFILNERDRGKLIIITTHILSFAEQLAEDIIFLLEGKIYFNGSLDELLNTQHEHNLEDAIAHILSESKTYSHV